MDVVARRPRRWLVLYARALSRIWGVIRPRWAAAAPLVERERERVEAAVGNGALPELIGDLHHRAALVDGRWILPESCRATLGFGDDAEELRIDADGLALMPILTGPGAHLVFSDEAVVGSVLYPLPGVARLVDGEVPPPDSALECLLGPHRVAILRELARPRRAGTLASRLALSPSALTHHLKALEASGLVLRERHRRWVIVRRTVRGAGLLDLYGDDGAVPRG